MNIITGILILIILIFIVEVLSIALKLTGLDMDKARFQVISIITNTGFTTKESELISQHPTRRKIAQALMLISYVGYAILLGLVVNILLSNSRLVYITIIFIVVSLVLLIIIRNKWLVNSFEKLIEKKLGKRMEKMKRHKTVEQVLKLNDEYGVAEFVIEDGNRLIGKTLGSSKLTHKHIQVLNIDRGSHIVHFPRGNSVFKQGDVVTVYGKLENIKHLVIKQYSTGLSHEK
ncbi:TrkA C-terminal domain-containing protein [Dethiothermospora halolimnae]|uniref:TrkA C-terminal domain-containing protein n=1 Tax=Dethiothermospora halolimnae TaxID=3114390 RepID=UPI003CCBB6A7